MKIPESTFKRLPEHLKALFKKLPNPGSDEVLALFPNTKGGTAVRRNSGGNTFGGDRPKPPMDDMGYGDTGSAARFFYCAKASRSDRNAGLEGMEERPGPGSKRTNPAPGRQAALGAPRANHHPTVKPTDLMRYLCRLVTPPGGTVLDPFTGSGSTGRGAVLEGFNFIGIEREAEYAEIARDRINAVRADAATAGISANNPAPTLFDCP